MSPDDLELAFALDALARPDDPLPRMAYADWLCERGDPRGELLQLRCRLVADPSLAEREQEMSQRPGLVWLEHHGLPLTKGLFLALFRRSLAEAGAWHKAFPAMRPVEFRPPIDEGGYFYIDRRAEVPGIVQNVIHGRASWLDDYHVSVPAIDRAEGRLLYFCPDQTLSDEAALAETPYFASDNSPPWDSWLWFEDSDIVERYVFDRLPDLGPILVSWVAPEYVEAVQRGIDVNPEECIRWADSVNLPLTATLREAGLLS